MSTCASSSRHAEQDPRAERHDQCEDQDVPVDLDRAVQREDEVEGHGDADQVDAPHRDQQPERAGHQREQDALDQHLADQPRAAGAQRGADTQLAPPRHGPLERQVGDVGDRDQQHAADRAQ
ncbi:hypothetical protein O0S08_06375 [Nannocystis poenicansa]|uniref:Uncharacterized protein n=1 Tax=Nannocystis punicea TaxID=2995304 RepID=A0ABY7H930_9BACT|nr:hypothetical protein [Nannocystis poenicansa]WAS95771.1 hypothetical protein O0S08_06375 [Nannocystis poenicansa]